MPTCIACYRAAYGSFSRRLWPVFCIALVAVSCRATAETVVRRVVMPGTVYETPYYVKAGEDPRGPKVFLIGGLHGNETAGYLAAGKIANWCVTRGTLVVMPEAHKEAIRRNVRAYPGNVNSMFPGDPQGSSMQRLAAAIWQVIELHRPNLLVTLHESVGYHSRSPERYGYTLCHDFPILNSLTQLCLDRVNPDIDETLNHFSNFVDPHPGCPTYCAWRLLSIPATSIETCRQEPLAVRVRHQLMMVMGFLDEAGLGYEQGDVPYLSTAGRAPAAPLEVWAPHLAALEAKREPPAGYALLRVVSDGPEAKVFVDGYYKGCTPMSTAVVAEARRALRVTVKSAQQTTYDGQVVVEPGDDMLVEANPASEASEVG